MSSPVLRALAERLEELQGRELPPIRVAVLDSGVDATHPDLTKFVDKAFGAEMTDGKCVLSEQEVPKNHDAFGHGTAVSSIIVKIAKNARITDYRVLGKDNTGAGEALITSLKHAIDADFPIINMSLAAKADFGPRLQPLCDAAYRKGQIIVAAKRNMPLVDLGYPAELTPSVISVERDKFPTQLHVRYQAANVIEFVGHGEEVVVAAPGGGYTTKTGTSFATAAVSGMVALLLGAYPELRPFEVKTILRALEG